jgi:thiol-disulfide isomerase/thioredoxin
MALRSGLRLGLVGIVLGMVLGGCGADAGLDQYGQKVPAAQFENQWLVINYWAEWCAPCRREIPELNGLAQEWADTGVQVFGVNFDGLQGPELTRASEAMGIQFRVLAQDPAPRLGLPRSEVLPVTYIVDDQGSVRERLAGEQTAEGLKAHLQRLRGH